MIIEEQVSGMSQSDPQPLLWMIVGRSVSENSDKMTWRSEWMPYRQKFSRKSFQTVGGQYHHRTVHKEVYGQKKKMPQNEEGSGMEWIFI